MIKEAIEKMKVFLAHSEESLRRMPDCMRCQGEIATYKRCIAILERIDSE